MAAADRGARARGPDARDLRARERPARLPPAARVPGGQARAYRRNFLYGRRGADHVGLAAGARSRQRRAAGAGGHRSDRAGKLPGLAHPARPPRGERRGHPARPRRHARRCRRCRARRPRAPRHPSQIHLHDPDRAESDRHDHAGTAAARAAEAVATIRRADLRGRLLRRPDLGWPPPARALRHERKRWRHPHRLVFQIDRAGAAGRLHRGALGDSVPHAIAQDRRRLRRVGTDGAGRVLRAAISPSTFRSSRAACEPSSTR